jgi:hypothetical protein
MFDFWVGFESPSAFKQALLASLQVLIHLLFSPDSARGCQTRILSTGVINSVVKYTLDFLKTQTD